MSWWRRNGGAQVALRVIDSRKPEAPPPVPTGDEAFDTLRRLVHEEGYLRPRQDGKGADPVVYDAPTIIICRSPFRARLGMRHRLR